MSKKTVSSKTRLVLRTSKTNLTSYNGFQWPEKGPVEAPDWQPTYECGNGLHGLLEGVGSTQYLNLDPTAKWQVVEVEEADLLTGQGDLTDKCKFRKGNVVYTGNRTDAIDYLANHGCPTEKMVFAVLSDTHDNSIVIGMGDYSTLTGGNGSKLTGGNGSELIGGNCSKLTGGDYSTLTGGCGSELTGGNYSTLTGGNDSKLTGGYDSTLTGGNGSKLTGGNGSKLTGGDDSILTGGNYSTLTGRNYSTLTGGDGSILNITWWDGNRYRQTIGYVGENGIKANVAYRCNHKGELVKA